MTGKTERFTAFAGETRIASGLLYIVALALRGAQAAGGALPMVLFDDRTGKSIDIDLRGTDDEIVTRYAPTAAGARPRGRPKLGVTSREVTLLPRHWEWLATQPGGASATLRRLVDEARKDSVAATRDAERQAAERAYHFLLVMAGDRAGFEEVTRALFADDRERFAELMREWPADVRAHALLLAEVVPTQ